MPVTLHCPACDAVLRSAKALAAGTKVKCPTCTKVFTVPDPDEEESPPAAISEKPTRTAAPARRPVRNDEDDEDDPAEEGRDEEEADERLRKKKKKKAKKASAGGGKGLLIGGIVGVVLLLLLGGGGVGAYFLFFAGNRGNDDPYAYLPADAGVIVGIDYPALLKDPALGPQLQQALTQQTNGNFIVEVKKQTGLEFQELYAQTYIAVKLGKNGVLNPAGGGFRPQGGAGVNEFPAEMTMVLRTSKPFSQRKIAAAARDPVKKSRNGKTYYEINESGIRTLYMPCDRIVVISGQTADQLGAVIGSDGAKPTLSGEVASTIRAVEQNTVWAVVPVTADMRNNLAPAGMPLPGLQPLNDALAQGRVLSVWGKSEGDQVKIGVGLRCGDPNGAGQVATSLGNAWKAQQGEMAQVEFGLALAAPKSAKLLQELKKTLQFSSESSTATVTATLGRQTFADAVTEWQRLGQQFQPGGMPGGGMPGGGMPPGRPPGRPGGGR